VQVNKARTHKLIEEMTLFDDMLMNLVFEGNHRATELLLNVILERNDMKVFTVRTQQEFRSPFEGGRSVRLDIYAEDSNGKSYDIEVQQANEGTDPRRARFNSGRIDSTMLMASQEFKELHDSYVIFITREDVMKGGLPMYHFERICKETGKQFGDGSYIIYVNGEYADVSHPVGKLMHDFWCREPEDMYYPPLIGAVRHFKREGGQERMSSLLEEYVQEERQEERQEYSRELILRMIKRGKYSFADIAETFEVSLEEVEKIAAMNMDNTVQKNKRM